MSPPQYLIILDLNGTILDSTHRSRAGVPVDATARHKRVYFRPYMHELVEFLLDNYKVAVWTSNIRENAQSIVDIVFGDRANELLFVWSRSECDILPHYKSLKHLSRVWNYYPAYGHNNTLLLDDSPEKVIGPKDCYVQVPAYKASMVSKQLDVFLNMILHMLRDGGPVDLPERVNKITN